MAGDQNFPDLMQRAGRLEAEGQIVEAIRLYKKAAAVIPGHAGPDTKIATLTARSLWGSPPNPEPSANEGSRRVTMSTLGQNGRFGNQIYQYAYLRFYAEACGARIETSDWIGRDLFGLDDPLVARPLPQLREGDFDASSLWRGGASPPADVDLLGYFQLPTGIQSSRMADFRRMFELCGRVRNQVDKAWDKLISGARGPVIAMHLRRTDFGYGQFWIAPTEWYQRWLDSVWSEFSAVGEPLLYIATDDPSALDVFRAYRPANADLADGFPTELRFIFDFSVLARADVLAIANSSFSHAASLLNERARLFVRPFPAMGSLEPFDPWASSPLLHSPWPEPSTSTAEVRIFSAVVQQGATVIDAAAGRGDWSRSAHAALLGRVHIFAFETNPQHLLGLRQWSALMKPGTVDIVDCGLGRAGGKPDGKAVGTGHGAEMSAGCTSLDSFCRTRNIRHINYLRVDFASAGLAILDGAQNLLSVARVDCVHFEYGEAFKTSDTRLRDVFLVLAKYGYKLFKIEHQLREIAQWHPLLENYRTASYIAVHSRLVGFLGLGPRTLPDIPSLLRYHGLVAKGAIHVGAHEGEEMEAYRKSGIARMIFIEANPNVYARLRDRHGHEPNVILVNKAAADANETRRFHVTNFTQSSSLLPLRDHTAIYPQIFESSAIDVPCVRLDDLIAELGVDPVDYDILNIDVQGAEMMVLRGAPELLRNVKLINIEVNFAELYAGCPQIEDIESFIIGCGFRRAALACPYHPSWGDAVYVRASSSELTDPLATAPEPPASAVTGVVGQQQNTRLRRNELCPCGSGRRYKHCHGKLI
jgi:FkbM family methyltransferase